MTAVAPLGSGQRLCANHPERPGHALCMACKKVVCQECATEWDGINYCVACLALRRKTVAASSSFFGWVLVAAAAALLFYASVHLMVWTGVFVTGLL